MDLKFGHRGNQNGLACQVGHVCHRFATPGAASSGYVVRAPYDSQCVQAARQVRPLQVFASRENRRLSSAARRAALPAEISYSGAPFERIVRSFVRPSCRVLDVTRGSGK